MCYKYLLLAGLTFLASQALAQGQLVEEIRCTNNDCLTSGYEKYDSDGNLMEIGICNNMNCDTDGWNIFRLDGFNTSVMCENSSCYGQGFSEIDPMNNSLVSVRSCNNGDCLANGWIDHTFIPAESIEGIQCNANGCEFGFLIEEIDGIMQDNSELRAELEAEKARLEAKIAKNQFRQQKIQNRIDALKDKKFKKRKKAKRKGIFRRLANLVKRYFKVEARIQKLRGKLAAVQAELDAIEDPAVINSQQAVCLAPGACFTAGYQVIE